MNIEKQIRWPENPYDHEHPNYGLFEEAVGLCRKAVEEARPGIQLDDIYEVLCNNRICQDDNGIVKMKFKDYNNYLWDLAKALHARFATEQTKP